MKQMDINDQYNLLIINVHLKPVELEGFEPSSKQGTQKLSTCLSFD